MKSELIVANRYAGALFEAAREQGAEQKVLEDLYAVRKQMQDVPELLPFLQHPKVTANAKHDMIQTAFGTNYSPLVLNTLQLLVRNGRESILTGLVSEYERIANEALGMANAVVTSVYPLSEAEGRQIAARFGEMTGKKIKIENIVDPSILGGISVRIGDRLYDGSLSTRLSGLQRTLNL